MKYEQNPWEKQFPEAILSVEELIARGDSSLVSKSKLRIAFEKNILNWSDYCTWACKHYGFAAFKDLSFDQIQHLQNLHNQRFEELLKTNPDYKKQDDFLEITFWDTTTFIAGVSPEGVELNQGQVFVFCSPEVLDQIKKTSFRTNISFSEQPRLTQSEPELPAFKNLSTSPSHKLPEGLMPTPSAAQNTIPPHIKPPQTPPPNLLQTDLNQRLWKNLSSKHNDFSYQARKNFDAYVVLKVTQDQKTELYKMDEDLEKEQLDRKIFSYDLTQGSPFQHVYETHFSEIFELKSLGLKILDFQYGCISAIKLGPKVVGFLVGFKTTYLSQDDISTLESISEKAV
ncbi:MAG: hypothetical protein ACK41T_10500 [Pseudobdellovibrio sp.]